jgi:hypothetical protein
MCQSPSTPIVPHRERQSAQQKRREKRAPRVHGGLPRSSCPVAPLIVRPKAFVSLSELASKDLWFSVKLPGLPNQIAKDCGLLANIKLIDANPEVPELRIIRYCSQRVAK